MSAATCVRANVEASRLEAADRDIGRVQSGAGDALVAQGQPTEQLLLFGAHSADPPGSTGHGSSGWRPSNVASTS